MLAWVSSAWRLTGEHRLRLDGRKPGQQVVIAPLCIHLFVNLSPVTSMGTNFECPASRAALTWLEQHRQKPWHAQIAQLLRV
jgi:hypothetical protein